MPLLSGGVATTGPLAAEARAARRGRSRRGRILLPALAAALCLPAGAQAATFTVDSTGDAGDDNRGDGICRTAAGACTLRAAIQTANGDPAHDTIVFSLAGGSEIEVAQELPHVTAPVELDGGAGVTLDGGALPAYTADPPRVGFSIRPPHGLTVRGTTGSTIRGLTVHSFPGAQIHLAGAVGATVAGNRLGTDAGGTASLGRPTPGPVDSAGVFANDTRDSRIGGDGADGNVVAATERGILVDGASSTVEVVGNQVGLTADGRSALPNRHEAIAALPSGDGTRPRDVTIADNTIAAAGWGEEPVGGHGIRLAGERLRALDNTIGYNRGGLVRDPVTGRSLGTLGASIRVQDSREVEIRRNRVADSWDHALLAQHGALEQLTVTGNAFGLSLDGTATEDAAGSPTANHGANIWLHGPTADATIGGDAPGEGNTFAGGQVGILLNGGSVRARVLGNLVGFTAGARAVAPPVIAGIVAQPDGTPGGVPTHGRFAGNRLAGIDGGSALLLYGGDRHVVERNAIGIDGDGDPVPGNAGIVAVGSRDLKVGGSAEEGRGNRVAAMEAAAIAISGDAGTETSVAGNVLGFDEQGRASAGFANDVGVYLYEDEERRTSPHDVTIGGATPAHGNTIGGGSANVFLAGSEVTGTEIVNNRLGLTPAGEPAGAGFGVYVQGAPGTRVGRPGRGNVIASALFDGVRLLGARPGRSVQGNAIGLGPAPSGASRANGETGVTILDGEAMVVGVDPGAPHGACDAAGACNRFGPSGRAGVVVRGNASAVVVRGNDFAHPQPSGWLPVDVGGDGPSALDERDADSGPNGRLNQPTGVQGTADRRNGVHHVTGVVESARPTALSVDLYEQEGDGPLGSGATFLGSVVPDERGRFALTVAQPTPRTRYTAVAHTAAGSSEFARACGARDRALGTDADDDGICDEWEALGVDYTQDGRADLTLPNAVVGRRNLYVELDAMSSELSTVAPRPDVSALKALTEAFRTSPAQVQLTWMGETDGTLFGEELPAARVLSQTRRDGLADDVGDLRYGEHGRPCDGWFGTDADRRTPDCFARLGARDLTVRYVAAVNGYVDAGRVVDTGGLTVDNRYVLLSTAATDEATLKLVAGGHPQCATTASCYAVASAYVLMHELGHTFGLAHGGAEADPMFNPAHLSVMSYTYAWPSARNPLDYARTGGLALDERAIDERDPFDLTAGQRAWQPRLTALRQVGGRLACILVNVPDGRPVSLDDASALEVIEHGVNDAGLDCLRPPAHEQQQLRGREEWSRANWSPNVPDVAPPGADRDGQPLSALPVPDPALEDSDDDGHPATTDVCPGRADPDQADANGDGIGDACVGDYHPSDLELGLSGPRRLSADRPAELTVRATEAWPFATPSATVAVTLPPGVEPAGPASGDGSFDPASGRWSTGAFDPHETRTLTLPVRATSEDGGAGGELVAELVEAAERDADSVPGNGDRDEDDLALRTVATVPSGSSDPQVDVDDARVVEGSRGEPRALRFRVSLSASTPVRTGFRATVSPGTATPGDDYTPLDRELSIGAWQRSTVVTVPVAPDAVPEPDETVTLRLSRLDGLHGGRLTATGTIADDERVAEPGDLMPFGCIRPPDPYDRCGIDAAGLSHGASDVALVGERHLYVASGGALAHLRRDPADERLVSAGCLLFASRGTSSEQPECTRLPRVRLPSGSTADPFGSVELERLLAAPAGDRLYVLVRNTSSGGGTAVASFAVDAATGALTFERCVGTEHTGSACTRRLGMPAIGAPALSFAPDGASLYVAGDRSLAIVGLDADGRVGSTVRCADGGEPSGRCWGLLEDDERTTALAFSPDGEAAATVSRGVVATVARDAVSGELTPLARRELSGAARVAWAPDGETLYVGDAVHGAIHLLDPATLETRSCIEGGARELGCAATAAADLTSVGALHVSADGRDLYADLGDGVAVFGRGADGTLSGGRCAEPPSGAGRCGDDGGPVDPGMPPTASAIVLDGDESTLWAGGLDRYLRVTRPPAGNRAPLCAEGVTGTRPGRPVALRLTCADPDGDRVTVRITQEPANGTVDELDAEAGTARYTPVERVRGDDALRFRGSDGAAESADAELRLPVANSAPVCTGTSATVRVRRTVTLLWSCRDADGDPVAVEPIGGPERGTLDGRRYTAPGGWSGTETIVLRGSDGFDRSEPFEATVAVQRPALDCPALTTPLRTYQWQTVERSLDCSDADGGPVTVAIAGQSGFLGFAEIDGSRLRYRARGVAGAETVTLHATDSFGEVYEHALPVGVMFGPPPAFTDNDRRGRR
jgi:CSLREA domain-containing protein